jgi:hypothetical protein
MAHGRKEDWALLGLLSTSAKAADERRRDRAGRRGRLLADGEKPKRRGMVAGMPAAEFMDLVPRDLNGAVGQAQQWSLSAGKREPGGPVPADAIARRDTRRYAIPPFR